MFLPKINKIQYTRIRQNQTKQNFRSKILANVPSNCQTYEAPEIVISLVKMNTTKTKPNKTKQNQTKPNKTKQKQTEQKLSYRL